MKVLGIDPSLRGTGYAVVRFENGAYAAVTYGKIPNPATRAVPSCLLEIEEVLTAVIREWEPDEAAIESTIYVQSYQTAIKLGAARGAAMIATARAGLSLHEYAPKRIKQSVVGRGGAGKHQVAFMIRSLLGLTTTPSPDAADALAIALTHIQSRTAAIRSALPENGR